MPVRRGFLLPLVCALAPLAAAGAGETLPGPIPAEVVDVIDGDTIAVRAHIWLGQEIAIRVRLAGIDAPELHGHCASETDLAERARTTLEALLADGAAVLRAVHNDRYGGRVVAQVESGEGAWTWRRRCWQPAWCGPTPAAVRGPTGARSLRQRAGDAGTVPLPGFQPVRSA